MKAHHIKTQSETDRLVIRPLENQDYEYWIEGIHDRYPSQNTYDADKMDLNGWNQEKFNEDVVAKFETFWEKDEVYVFGVFRKSDQKHIGKVEICTLMRDEFQWGLLGYTIHNQFWRKGYGKEAVKETLNMAFETLGFHRIEAHINIDNRPSIQLAESVGMDYECTRKAFIYEGHEWTDNLVYYMNQSKS